MPRHAGPAKPRLTMPRRTEPSRARPATPNRATHTAPDHAGPNLACHAMPRQTQPEQAKPDLAAPAKGSGCAAFDIVSRRAKQIGERFKVTILLPQPRNIALARDQQRRCVILDILDAHVSPSDRSA
jgi:hypothetical protein